MLALGTALVTFPLGGFSKFEDEQVAFEVPSSRLGPTKTTNLTACQTIDL